MLDKIKIAVLGEQSVWFVRANGGLHVPHFLHKGVITVGHLEAIYGENLPSEIPTHDEVKAKLLTDDKYTEFVENNEGRQTKKLNRKGFQLASQMDVFVSSIKKGDLVVTKNYDSSYLVGICTGDAYLDFEEISLPIPEKRKIRERDTIRVKYSLRKNVTWGPTINPTLLPNELRKALRGRHTISNLTTHREMVFHLLYPFFTDGKHLYASNRIQTKKPINSLAVGKLFQNIALVEPLIQALIKGDIDSEALLTLLEQSLTGNGLSSTCKAAFASPGDVWCKIPLSKAMLIAPQVVAGVFACLILTGQLDMADVLAMTNVEASTVIESDTSINVPNQMLNDKFLDGNPSPLLAQIAEATLGNEAEISELDNRLSASQVAKNLELKVPEVRTGKLEDFDFGIEVYLVGGDK